jgi:uncharacterized membrane protein YhfC
MENEFFSHLLNAVLMILMPVILGIFLNYKFRLGWRLWWIGAVTFVASQIAHLPFNGVLTILFEQGFIPSPPEQWQLIFNSLLLGLSAGLWEEIANYATYRWWAKDARSWNKALMLGAGHGGIESIILGVIVLITFINMVVLRNMDLGNTVPVESLPAVQEQVRLYWSLPWYESLLGAFERLFTLIYHLSASVLVLQVFIRKQNRWLVFAVGWHTIVNAGALFIMGTWGPYFAEAWVAGVGLVSLFIIFILRNPSRDLDSENSIEIVSEKYSEVKLTELEITDENLENTRFN